MNFPGIQGKIAGYMLSQGAIVREKLENFQIIKNYLDHHMMSECWDHFMIVY